MLEHIDSKGRQLHRCHHCATAVCSLHGNRPVIGGERQIREGGCSEYTFLDPMLRPARYEGKRRIKKITTITFTEENSIYIERKVVPSNVKMFQGHFNRGVEAVINDRLAKFGDDIPLIPKIERGSGVLRVEKKIALSPECMTNVRAVIEHFKGTENRTSISQVVNYFIDTLRDDENKMREQAHG